MAFIFITGSTDGLGRAAAQTLIGQGHRIVLHARSPQRAATLADLSPRSAGIVVGDLRSTVETRSIADQVNAIGRMDAVIHNAGIYRDRNLGEPALAALIHRAEVLVIPGRDHMLATGDRAYKRGVLAFLHRRP